jgi:pimeloyl-ACP methyl ester carboxylesterase
MLHAASTRVHVLLGSMLALLVAACVAPPNASKGHQFGDLTVTVEGQGRRVLMIHGMDGASAVWRDTCARLQPGVQCLMVQLPGFAGAPPVARDRYLEPVRDQLLAYIARGAPERTSLLAHSLGGVIALMMVAKDDTSIDKVVLLDVLPFVPALFEPAKTADAARPGASAMRDGMLKAPDEPLASVTDSLLKRAVRNKDQAEQLGRWRLSTDRATAAQAMYELMTTDLRSQLPLIRRPVLVLGSWAPFAPHGATKAGSTALYTRQYAGLTTLTLKFSEDGYHFLMLDDPEWASQEVRGFLVR